MQDSEIKKYVVKPFPLFSKMAIIGLMLGLIIGIVIGMVFLRTFMTNYTFKLEKDYTKCAEMYNGLLAEYKGAAYPQYNFNVSYFPNETHS